MENKYIIINENLKGTRLDLILTNEFKDKSRSYIQNKIEKGNVLVNGKIKKSNYKVKLGDKITAYIPKSTELKIEPENIDLDIIYQDEDVLVVNKPQGMVVHPATNNYSGTLVNALLYHCKNLSKVNGVTRPGIVHRIDKDTSGILVVAKNDNSHDKLAQQLKNHSMTREYIALVEGKLKEYKGTINAPLARHPSERIKIAVVEGGREAITHYEVMEMYKNNTLVKCILETGRTHQIRVHMSYIAHPLVGDAVYGLKKQRFNLKGQMLHAKKLGFIHPTKNQYMEFETPIPEYFQRIVNIVKND
ncbi:ribosomal large subunit pseudouridine synthase D [Clostridium acetireducens DSM 10703]|uniref:Pseudouridine synthase n=1 Tax=Clostridium acetireducens DSM 10703 TaxID=1121290 RepID=A0A1E8F1Q6_9CLOT|nr:RluA family pseudouridine synthase [Clostridium acetireducens]OFI07566.1 ribosomal large subunit pseudouridine synthase D [Clostridium acetireducens DSM 10703]